MKKIRWRTVDVATEHSKQDPKIKQKIKITKYKLPALYTVYSIMYKGRMSKYCSSGSVLAKVLKISGLDLFRMYNPRRPRRLSGGRTVHL